MNPTGVAGTMSSGLGGTGATTPTTTAGTSSMGTAGGGASGTGSSIPKAGTSASSTAGTAAATAGTGVAGTPAMAAAGTGAAGTPATGGTGAAMTAGGGAPPVPGAGSCGPETMIPAASLGNVMMKGPWTPTMKASSGPAGRSTLFYPMDLGKDGVTHPVFHWGCGAGSQPSQYADHLNQLASHGIVVIANASGSAPAKASLDWILAENDKEGSVFYKKLDPKRVGAGGHSLGSLETLDFADDPRLTTYVFVCGGTFAGGMSPAGKIHAPAIYLGGKGEMGTVQYESLDWPATKGPAVFVKHSNTTHVACARDDLGPWVAFMRWNMCGEEKWKPEFMPGGTYCKAPFEACETKGL